MTADWQHVRREMDGKRRKTSELAGRHASIMPTSHTSDGFSEPQPALYEQPAHHQSGTANLSAHNQSVEDRLSNALGARAVYTTHPLRTPPHPQNLHRSLSTVQASQVPQHRSSEQDDDLSQEALYPGSISEEQQPTFSVAPSRSQTFQPSGLVSATHASPPLLNDTSGLQPKSKRPRYNQWGGPWPANEMPGQQTLVPDRLIQTQQSLPAASFADRQRAASTIAEARSPDEQIETPVQPARKPFSGSGPAPDRPDNPNNTNRKFFDFPPVFGSYLHYSNKKLKYNPFPADLDVVREKLFHVKEPMLLNSQQIADYWPHVSNFWQRSRGPTVEENGTQVEIWECRNRRRVQRTEVPSHGKGVRKKEKKNKILEDILQCKPRIRLCSFTKHADTNEEHCWSGNEKSWRQICKCMPEWLYIERTADTLRNDKEHTHDMANLDRFKRSDAIMYFCKLKVEEGGYSYSAVTNWVKENYGYITKQCETLNKQDVANISQHWRRANRDLELKTVVEDEPLDVQMMKKTLDAIESATDTGVRKVLAAVIKHFPEAYVHALPILEAHKAELSHETVDSGIKEGPTKELVKIVPEPGLPEKIYIEPPDYMRPTPERDTAAPAKAESQVFRDNQHAPRAAHDLRNVASGPPAQQSQMSPSQHHRQCSRPFAPASSGSLSQKGGPLLAPRPSMSDRPQPRGQQTPYTSQQVTLAGPPPPQLYQAPTPVQRPAPYIPNQPQPPSAYGHHTSQRPCHPQQTPYCTQQQQAYSLSPHGLPPWDKRALGAIPNNMSSEPRPSWLGPINPRKRRITESGNISETSADVQPKLREEIASASVGAQGPTSTEADAASETLDRPKEVASSGVSNSAPSQYTSRASEHRSEQIGTASTHPSELLTGSAATNVQQQPRPAAGRTERSDAERSPPLSTQQSPELDKPAAATNERTLSSAIEPRDAESVVVSHAQLGEGEETLQSISSPRFRVFEAAFERWLHNPGKPRPEKGIKTHHFLNGVNKRILTDDAWLEGAEATAAIKALYEEKKIEEAEGLVYFWP